jgi:hypothetical protein
VRLTVLLRRWLLAGFITTGNNITKTVTARVTITRCCTHARNQFAKDMENAPIAIQKIQSPLNTVLRGDGGPWQGRAGQASCAILEYQKDGMKANPNQTGERDC